MHIFFLHAGEIPSTVEDYESIDNFNSSFQEPSVQALPLDYNEAYDEDEDYDEQYQDCDEEYPSQEYSDYTGNSRKRIKYSVLSLSLNYDFFSCQHWGP